MIYSSFDLRKNETLQHPDVHVVMHRRYQKLQFDNNKSFSAQENDINVCELSQIFTDEYPSPEVYTAYVKNILVSPRPVGFPRYWSMFFDKHYIYNFIGEQAKNSYAEKGVFKRLPYDHIEFNPDPINPIFIPGKSVWLFTFKNVDHLVRECLPALLTLKESGENFKLLNFILPSTNADILELLFSMGVPTENIIQIDSRWIRFEELILPCFSSLGHLHTPTKYYTDTSIYLRDQILKLNLNINPPKRIYVSRKNAKMRRLLNEDVLHSGLLKRGFTIIEPGEYSKKEQVVLFSKAEIVIGQHGMGIANVAFSDSLKLLLEIMSTSYNRVSYFRTAQLLGCDYAAYYVEPEDKRYALPTDPSGDILIDPKIFFKHLDIQIEKATKNPKIKQLKGELTINGIDHIFINNGSNKLFITTTALNATGYSGVASNSKFTEFNHLFIADLESKYYTDPRYMELIKHYLSQHDSRKSIVWGTSMGGYFALKISLMCGVNCLVNCPQLNYVESYENAWPDLKEKLELIKNEFEDLSTIKVSNENIKIHYYTGTHKIDSTNTAIFNSLVSKHKNINASINEYDNPQHILLFKNFEEFKTAVNLLINEIGV